MMMRSLSWLVLPVFLATGPVSRVSVDPQVTSLSLSSSGGTARLAIAVQAPVFVRQAVLHSPERLVLDLMGATISDAKPYDGVRRGNVVAVRTQGYDGYVRVVLEFERMPAYTVDTATAGLVTVAFADGAFASWASGDGAARAMSRAATVAAPPAVDAVVLQAPPVRSPVQQAQQQQGNLISVHYDNTPIADVMDQFSRYSGRSIILGTKVSGNVTATITQATWQNAFRAVLASQGLSSSEIEGGIIRVDAPGELAKLDSIEVLEPVQIRLNYAKAGEMARVVKDGGLLTKVRGSVTADSGTNSLIITDTRTRVASIESFVRSLDIKTQTIAIEAKLIFVDRTDLEQLGVQYDIGTSQQFFNQLVQRTDPLTGQPYNPNVNVVNLGGNAISAISNADGLISGSALNLVFSTAIGGFSVTSFLSALARVELTDVEASPTVHTTDNRQAILVSGEQTPVRVIDASSFGQANQAPRANVSFKETGIKLTATPHVTANRQIQLILDVERSSIQPIAAADLGFNIPIQHVSNQLLVNDGETAVAGGLTVTTVTHNRSGIPMLMSLPFVGQLFSFSDNQEHRQDLIILVTPRIIDDQLPQN